MKRTKTKGILNGIAAAVSYGTNPLFALPMMTAGLSVNSVLFYRYFLATIIYGLFLKYIKKISLHAEKDELLALLVLALLFSFSSLTMYSSFKYIDSGLACTILFSYPTFVALINRVFFKEKLSKAIIFSIFIISFGIILLYNGDGAEKLDIRGVLFALAGGFFYALYMVGVKSFKSVKSIKKDKLSFYVMLFGLLVYIVNSRFCTQLEGINSPLVLICAILIALVPTILSIETTNVAIKLMGSTKTALLGALEPITAIVFSLLFFGGVLTLKISIGVLMILFGVGFAILKK